MRLRAGILSVVAAGLLALGCGAAPTLAAPPRDMLTSKEYALLTASRMGLQSALTEKQPNWIVAAQNACGTLTYETSTPLLASQKASCLASLELRVELTGFSPAFKKCAKGGVKRTVLCRAPLYQQLARNAANAYTVERKAQQAIVKRGFTGACISLLGSTPPQLRNSRKLAASTRKLYAYWHLLVRVDERKAPLSEFKQRKLNHDAKVVSKDIHLVSGAFAHTDLNGCPHPPA